MSTSFTWLITGASRGIGLELTRQLIASVENTVIASCRDPVGAKSLQALKADARPGSLYIVQLDAGDEASIRNSVATVGAILGDRGLDYLYNNGAVTEGDDGAFDHSYSGFMRTLKINVAGPALLGQLYLPYLEKSARRTIVNVTTGLASFGLDIGPKSATYSISKTAINMLTYKQAKARPDIIAIAMDPGWVKTVMGGEGAILEPEESAAGAIKVVTSLTAAQSGRALRYNGSEVVR
ncbi:C-factor [Amylocystis lapponica]|nr:C-factor [Amylocystis lapponica]